jgi:glutathione reductase (NADPH)
MGVMSAKAYDFDLFVIGAGSGGVRAARLAAMAGAKVGVAEAYRVGGTCVIRGCVPKKFMVYASEFSRDFEVARGYGWSIENASFDWRAFLINKDKEIARLSGVYTRNLNNAGADLIMGRARFLDPHALEISDEDGKIRKLTAEKVLIATGGRPKLPELPGIEHVITSDDAFHLARLPKSMVIVGGGYIAVEFACIFHGLGVDVTLVYRGPNILRGFDDDVRSHLADELNKKGVKVLLSCRHQRIEKRADGVLVSHFVENMPIEAEMVMFATGREPNVEGLGLDKAGVKLNESGAVAVDEYSRTSVEHIWAVGDVTDRLALTPVAIREAVAFAETVFHGRPTAFDHANVPTAVFSQPPIGVVGLTEAEARRQHRQIDIYLTRFRPMKLAFVADDERILMKLVVERASGRVLGVHIVGHDGPEMIQLAAIAVKAGLTKAQWDATCALHPTAAEELVTLREPYVPQELAAAE